MSIELFDDEGNRTVPQGEPLWRGVTMAIYERGRWFKQANDVAAFPPAALTSGDEDGPTLRPTVRQQIKLEANDSNVLFGLRPMLNATTRQRTSIALNAIDGTISRNDNRPGTVDYEVRSALDPSLPQPGERAPNPYRRVNLLLGMPEGLRPRFKAIAERVIARAVPEDRRDDVVAKAQALEAYLRDSREFGYTLKLDVIDPRLDPVEDFLINRKEGHCEYFASALTLLLRAAGIPARLVNGFKGGDWNGLARVMSVRQKHAHSWVEAYIGPAPGPGRAANWLTLDPTPGTERDRSVAQVGGFSGRNFRFFTDFVRYIWVFYIVGYNAERQNRLIYGPIRAVAEEARKGFAQIGRDLSGAAAQVKQLLHFQNVQSFISIRGFFVSFVGLSLLAILIKGAAWLVRRLLKLWRGPGEEDDGTSAGAAFYRRLAELLARCGLERPPAETQDEFARRATVFLTARGSTTEPVADVPRLVVDAFYRVRFGHRDLAPGADRLLEQRLDALEKTLADSGA
jgi:transglutaminase-like putative cysteine protease